MLTIQPRAVFTGNYKYRPVNNTSPQIFFYTAYHEIFRLHDLSLASAGRLPQIAQLGYCMLAFHPREALAAFITVKNNLALGNFNGEIIWQNDGKFETVFCAANGEQVWAAERLANELVRVQLFDMQTGGPLGVLEMADPQCQSALRFDDIPHTDKVTLEFAAAQDGITNYELEFTGGVISAQEMFAEKASYTALAWHPHGHDLLALENDAGLYARFSYPDRQRLGAEPQRDDDLPDAEYEELAPGFYLLYLKNGLAVTQNINNRFFLFDPQSMTRLTELSFAGYPLKKVNEVFAMLKDDTALYSEVSQLERVGNLIMARTAFENRVEQDLLVMDEDDFCDQIAKELARRHN